jgi:chloramphenicol-sensitive protein RarD
LGTIGFLQYITPKLHFLLAVVVYGEPFSSVHLASFLCIWAGLICYSWDAWRALAAQRMLRN